MIKRHILPGVLAAGLGLAAMSGEAGAVVVNVGGSDYDVTTLEGTFEDNSTLLTSQIWWGNEGLAEQFADVVGQSLGTFYTPLPGGNGPIFAYMTTFIDDWTGTRTEVGGCISRWFDADEDCDQYMVNSTSSSTYAVVAAAPDAAVPLPAAAWFLGSALLAAFGVSRRKQA
ncbi:hypothetical protein [Mangrovicoccus ximenensis]|uniref:hypothetical protein n=1 Tax=Mangrovicoccus ximenensis TaxID=1911570 RepID=UPI000D347AEC|nr:hypothetical protein [Mangrovicoccus ximenensis]